jgi:hypothetical protein
MSAARDGGSYNGSNEEKSAMAGRHRQHASRVRSTKKEKGGDDSLPPSSRNERLA